MPRAANTQSVFAAFERSSSWQLKGCEETFKPVTMLQLRHRNQDCHRETTPAPLRPKVFDTEELRP